MRSSLKDQLSLEELRHEFERFADSKIARELPDFYKACLDREEIDDFFERQAATSAIIDRLVYLKDAVQYSTVVVGFFLSTTGGQRFKNTHTEGSGGGVDVSLKPLFF